MRMILILLGILLSFAAEASPQQRVGIFAQQVQLFHEICVDQTGEFQSGVFWDARSERTIMDCPAQAGELERERQAIDREIQSLGGESCELPVTDPNIMQFLGVSGDVIDEVNCPGMQTASVCASQVACNIATSIMPGGSLLREFVAARSNNMVCDGGAGSCSEEFVRGIGYMLWDTISGIGQAVGYVGCKAWDAVADRFSERNRCGGDQAAAAEAEGNLDTRAAAASGVSNSGWAQFVSDPFAFIRRFLGSMVDGIGDSIRSRFGCRDRDNIVAECNQSQAELAFECTSCSQKLNMVCGTGGYIFGEVVATFFTGGAFQVAKRGAQAILATRRVSAVADAAASSRILQMTATQTARFGRFAGQRLGALWTGISTSLPVRALARANQAARSGIFVYARGQDALVAAARRYNELHEQAFNLGYRLGEPAAARARAVSLSRSPTVAQAEEAFGRRNITDTELRNWLLGRLPARERQLYEIRRTTDRPPRLIAVSNRERDAGSGVIVGTTQPRGPVGASANANLPPPAMPRPAPVAPARQVDAVPDRTPPPQPETIVVTPIPIDRTRYPDLPVSTRTDDDLVRAFGGDTPYNRELSRVAREEYTTPGHFDRSAYDLHNSWMDANPQLRATQPERFVDYDELPASIKSTYADELERAFREGNPELISSQAFQDYRAALRGNPDLTGGVADSLSPPVVPGGAARVDDAAGTVTAGRITPDGTPGPSGIVVGGPTRVTGGAVPRPEVSGVTVGRNLEGATDARTVTDITSGQVRSGGAADDHIRRFGGDDVSFQDREYIMDIILGGPRRRDYAGRPRYEELRARIEADPDLPRYRADVEALAADRIRVGNQLTDDEIADLSRSGVRSADGYPTPIPCRALGNVTPGAFPESGNCRRLKFDEDVNGRYCSCGGMSKTSFTWLVRCPRSGSDFRSLSTYVDELALPAGSAPEMCERVDIPRGKECYIGPTSATFAGFGGTTQILCEHRAPRLRPPITPEAQRLYDQQLADIQEFGLDFGGEAVRPVRWSPFSTFSEYQDIIQRAATACPRVCDPETLLSIQQEYRRAQAAIRARGNPADLARLEAEDIVFSRYLDELRNGRRASPVEGAPLAPDVLPPAPARGGDDFLTPPRINPDPVRGGTPITTGATPRGTRPVPSPAELETLLTPELRRVAGLGDDARVTEAGRALGRDLTGPQRQALLAAHNVGEGTGRGLFTYTEAERIQKGLILRRAGFSEQETQLLLDRGFAGSLPGGIDFDSARGLASRSQDTVRSLNRSSPPRVDMDQLRRDFRTAGSGYEAQALRDPTGATVRGAVLNYARSGSQGDTVRMMELAATQGNRTPRQVLDGVEQDLRSLRAQDGAMTNPALVLERQTLQAARDEFARRNGLGGSGGITVGTSAPPRAATPGQGAPAQPAPVQSAPAQPAAASAPPPARPQLRPVEEIPVDRAQGLANDYRLGQNGKPRDLGRSAELYYRATVRRSPTGSQETFARAEGRRTRGFQTDTQFMNDRNFSAAFMQSFDVDGALAIRMLDDIAEAGGEARRMSAVNAFLAENFDRFNTAAGRFPTALQRENFRRFVQHVRDNYGDGLYGPQRNYLSSWTSRQSE